MLEQARHGFGPGVVVAREAFWGQVVLSFRLFDTRTFL
jgi:hypothetical protein